MNQPVRKAGGGLITKLAGEVAREAPELARGSAARHAVVNIGLDINGGERLHPEEAIAAIQRLGGKPVRAMIAQSDTEPTLVVELERALDPDAAHKLSADLKQEAIAQVDENGVGDLHGPAADKWKPFNGDYFIHPSGKRLTQAVMDAGSGEHPGGVDPDPVMQKLGEIAASLKGEPVHRAGGGLIEKAASMLLGAAEHTPEVQPMRLYHGTMRGGGAGFSELSPNRKISQLGLHMGTQPQANYFANGREHLSDADIALNKSYFQSQTPDHGRIVPLDVTLQNPLRLEDRTGSWWPSEIYDQLSKQGKVKFDKNTFEDLRDMEGSSDPATQQQAVGAVRKMIENAGHDGVVYTNRLEGFTTDDPIRDRFKQRGLQDINADDKTFLDVVPEAKGNDSYIVWDKNKYRSPFGDGTGAGFANGGEVEGYASGGVVRRLGAGLVDLLDFGGVAGRPKNVIIPGRGEFAAAPIKEIDDAAESYMKKAGIPGTHRIEAYPQFDEGFASRLAQAYGDAQHAPNDPAVRRAYDALIEETMGQYKALKDTGLDVRFLKDGMADPYAKSPSMGYADMVDNGRLWVYPTDFGYGSNAAFDPSENPLLKRVGRVGDKEDAVANDAFRVVHDAYGHFGPGNPFFRHQGEDRAWQHHGRMFSDDALPAMTAETRGQNSWLNFGPHGAANRSASGADTVFADQKATIMPPWAYEKDLGRTPYAGGGHVTPEEAQGMTHTDSYGVGSEPAYLRTMGTKIPLGDGPIYYHDDGSTYAPRNEGPQALHDVARMGLYALPGAGPAIGTALDTAEAGLTGSPGEAAAAAVMGPTSKKVKAVASAIGAAMGGAGDADAGVFGRLGKWALSSEGKDAFNEALKMSTQGADDATIMSKTGWFKDIDGHWKYFRTSSGGGYEYNPKGKGLLPNYYTDPHLFDEYPHMQDIRFRRKNEEGAHWDEPFETIVLGDTSKPGYNTPDAGGKYGAVTHEVYHAKATHEGWPQGTSVEEGQNKVNEAIAKLSQVRSDPSVMALAKTLYTTGGSDLPFQRYQAELGEALARREASMREITDEHLRGLTPAAQPYLDMPQSVLFHPGENIDPAKYRQLMQIVDDRRVARDMANASAAPKKKGRP